MQLYTFILEYRGGTYISQFEGETVEAATHAWACELDTAPIAHFHKKHLRIAREQLDEDGLVEVDSVKNVWCRTFSIQKHLGLLNIIQTDSV